MSSMPSASIHPASCVNSPYTHLPHPYGGQVKRLRQRRDEPPHTIGEHDGENGDKACGLQAARRRGGERGSLALDITEEAHTLKQQERPHQRRKDVSRLLGGGHRFIPVKKKIAVIRFRRHRAVVRDIPIRVLGEIPVHGMVDLSVERCPLPDGHPAQHLGHSGGKAVQRGDGKEHGGHQAQRRRSRAHICGPMGERR